MERLIATVQLYIHLRTGKEVNISISSAKDVILLNKAYAIAQDWINKNVTDIQMIWEIYTETQLHGI